MIYDLVVIGNGLAAQVFLYELFRDVNKSQNFSVAQIFSEEMAPACSLRSSASVSLSGIEEGVSELGDELRKSFFHFEQFYQLHKPFGIEEVEQYIGVFDEDKNIEEEKEKLTRRYKKIETLKHPLVNRPFYGIKLQSYIVSPLQLAKWFEKVIEEKNIIRHRNFLQSIFKNTEGQIECHMLGGEQILARKILLCTGAYAKINAAFFNLDPALEKTQVVAGSFLERTVDLNCDSFYFTFKGHNLIYRNSDHQLILGSASTKGPFTVPDFKILSGLLSFFSENMNIKLGELQDFKIRTGARHKGVKRRPIYKALDESQSIFLMSAFYKNGYTFPFYTAKEMVKNFIN